MSDCLPRGTPGTVFSRFFPLFIHIRVVFHCIYALRIDHHAVKSINVCSSLFHYERANSAKLCRTAQKPPTAMETRQRK